MSDFLQKLRYVYAFDQLHNRRSVPSLKEIGSKTLVVRSLILPFALIMVFLFSIFLILSGKRKSISVFILRCYRPAFASTYISMVEPIVRQISNQVDKKEKTILVNPGGSFNFVFESSYRKHFDYYLDDDHKFIRLVFFLLPSFLVNKKKIDPQTFQYSRLWMLKPIESDYCGNIFSEIGLTRGNFVCIGHPSLKYYKNRNLQNISNWSRFLDLSEYLLPLRYLHDSGYKIVRIGVDTDPIPLALESIPIHDYSGSSRTERGELWLFQNCKFVWSIGGNGAWWFGQKFGIRSLLTDGYQFIHGFNGSLYTQQAIFSISENRLLNFKEQMMLPDTANKESLSRHGMIMVQNPPKLVVECLKDMFVLCDEVKILSQNQKKLITDFNEMVSRVIELEIDDGWSKPCMSFLEFYKDLII